MLRHFGRKDVIEHIDFPEVSKSILEGLGRFADNHLLLLFAIKNDPANRELRICSQNTYSLNLPFTFPTF
jgi:hypothetical protein